MQVNSFNTGVGQIPNKIKEKALCVSDRLYFEGDVEIVNSDNNNQSSRIVFSGDCVYIDYEFLAIFKGKMKNDSFVRGIYHSPYCVLGTEDRPY